MHVYVKWNLVNFHGNFLTDWEGKGGASSFWGFGKWNLELSIVVKSRIFEIFLNNLNVNQEWKITQNKWGIPKRKKFHFPSGF